MTRRRPLHPRIARVCAGIACALLGGAASAQPPGTPAAAGTLAVRVSQGTRGAPAITGGEVEVYYMLGDRPAHQVKAQLDERGMVVLGQVPVELGVRPLVRVQHAGVTFQDTGPIMDADHASATLDVTVYETTDQVPAWRVEMRHVLARAVPGGMAVAETIVVQNPADTTWLGGEPTAKGRRPTVTLALAPGATNVRLDAGFHGWCCTEFENGRLLIEMPLMPGRASYKFSYELPAVQGRADLRLAAPAPVDHAMFFVPDDTSAPETVGLEPAGTQVVQSATMRMFHAQGVTPDAPFGLVLTGLGAGAVPLRPPESSLGAWVMGGAAGAVLAGGAAIWIRARRRGAARAAR